MPVFLWIGDVYFYFREFHEFIRGSMSTVNFTHLSDQAKRLLIPNQVLGGIGLLLLQDSVIHGFLRFTTQQLALEFPLSSHLHPCKRFHGFFWPFGPASIIAAKILLVLTGTRNRTYRFVLPFELPAFLSQEKQNLTAAVSRKQPGHKFRYSRKGW